MCRLVILSLVAVTALAADLDEKHCVRMFHPHSIGCCKKVSDMKEKIFDDDLKECFQGHKGPPSCEPEICIAKKKGFATDDGKLDKTKLEEQMSSKIYDKDLLADLKKNCFDGDLEKYGPAEFCDFMKIKHCFAMQVLNHCTEWNDFADCSELKGVVAECVKLVS